MTKSLKDSPVEILLKSHEKISFCVLHDNVKYWQTLDREEIWDVLVHNFSRHNYV